MFKGVYIQRALLFIYRATSSIDLINVFTMRSVAILEGRMRGLAVLHSAAQTMPSSFFAVDEHVYLD